MAEGERIMSGYTPDPADVEYRELIHAILWDAIWRGSGPSRLDADTAMWLNAGLKRGIAGLAEKGRLVPPDADTQWAIRLTTNLGGVWIMPRDSEAQAREFFEDPEDAENAELVMRLVGPWLPVPDKEES